MDEENRVTRVGNAVVLYRDLVRGVRMIVRIDGIFIN